MTINEWWKAWQGIELHATEIRVAASVRTHIAVLALDGCEVSRMTFGDWREVVFTTPRASAIWALEIYDMDGTLLWYHIDQSGCGARELIVLQPGEYPSTRLH